MADGKMVFPIGFDLEKGLKEAGDDWDKKYAKRLEDLIAKRPVNIRLKFDTSKLDNLDAVKDRLARLKVEPITPETKAAIKELAAELRTLAKALEQVQKYSTRAGGTPEAVRNSKIAVNEERAKAQAALAAQRTARAEYNLAAARDKAAQAATRGTTATRNLSREFQSQDGYISRLIKRLAVYAGFSAIRTFATAVREVTAEFELQRVSLGAIIQDQQKANELFSEIKSFALKSPVSILDLTKYTKQLAAYKIGVNELFETTKKLTDVSVGLGVSMDRVVLAYGQVRAAGYLRASEIRQFTEMGVPIVEELAAKLSKMNGELVTAAQVMDMVSKRGISFEMVKEVFDDMTSAGGMFYQMQEKQGNTLFGMWAKLGDAASVMYEEIGNTDSVNSMMKGAIELLTDFMRNWKDVARYTEVFGLAILGLIVRKKLLAVEIAKVDAIQRTYNARMVQANALASSNSRLVRAQGVAMGVYAQSMRFASTTAAAFGTSLKAIKSALVTTGWGALAVALGYVVDKLFLAKTSAEQAAEALNKVVGETGLEQSKSVRNFEYLANVAVQAADGSSKQKEALEELQRTYKNILPQEVLELDYLKQLKGNYDSLTQSIREYVAEQQRRKAVEEVANTFGAEKLKYERNATKIFEEEGWSTQEIARFWERFYEAAKDPSKTLKDVVRESLVFAGRDAEKDFETIFRKLPENAGLGGRGGALAKWFKGNFGGSIWNVDEVDMLRDSILEENKALDITEERMKAAGAASSEFAQAQEKSAEKVKNAILKLSSGGMVDRDSLLGQQMLKNLQITDFTNGLKERFEKAGIEWKSSFGDFIEQVNASTPELISSLNFSEIVTSITEALENPELTEAQRKYLTDLLSFAREAQMAYDELVPSDPVVKQVRAKFFEIAQSTGASEKLMRRFLWDGKTSLDDHIKTLKDQIADYEAQIFKMNAAIAKGGVLGMYAQQQFGAKIEEQRKMIEALKEIMAFEQTYVPESNKKKGSGSDNRLSELKEIEQTLSKINQKYEELLKKEGAAKALADIKKIYGDTLNYINSLGQKFGLAFEMPTDFGALQDYRKAIKKVIETLKMKGHEKAALELQTKIDTGDIDKLGKQIEDKIKALSDKLSRTKTAREFYDKILSQTGDVDVAATLTMNVYGNAGADLFRQTAAQIEEYFSGVEVELPINFETEHIDYKKLREIWEADKALPEGMRKIPAEYDASIKQMLDSADSANRKMIEGWLKATEKAKTYGDKLADVYRKTATEIEAIQKKMDSGQLDKGIGSDLIAGFKRKEAEEIAKLQYEAFKDSPMYVQMFDDLGSASTTMLKAMRDRLVTLKDEWKNLDPTQLKEMQQRLREIDEQLMSRNPFKTLANSIKQYRKLRTKGDDLGSKSSGEADKKLLKATEERIAAEKEYLKLLEDENATAEELAAAKENLDKAEGNEKAAQKSKEVWQDVNLAMGSATDTILSGLGAIGDIANGVADIMESMGADAEDVAYWRTIGSSISEITAGLQDVVQSIMKGDLMGVITGVITAIPKMFVGFSNLFSAGRVRKANKEIKKQQELLDHLAYTYARLEKAAEKALGADFIRNSKEQEKNLKAQAEAYRKQIEAEKSKGKKKDEEKIKEYEEAWRDTMDSIADMQGRLSEKMTGSDLASASRDMARAWIDAYKEIGRAGAKTTQAMKEQFQDMVENMVVEGALSAVMQRALQPMFNMIDNMNEQDFYNESFWKKVAATAEKGAADADAGATMMMQFLKQAGISIGEISDEFTGIKREVAGASSEEVNANTAALNAQTYYLSRVPNLDVNVALIRQYLENGAGGAAAATAASGWTDWQTQAMDQYMAIQRNTAENVVEARRAAQAAEAAVGELQRIIRPRNTPSTHSLHVTIDG